MRWTIAESWAAATEVVALVYGVDVEGVRAASRGRGPKPPLLIRAPRKAAVWLTVQVSGCDYASVGREIGLHKDTVSSHVAEVGKHDTLPGVEAASDMLLNVVRARLLIASTRRGEFVPLDPRAVLVAEIRQLIDALRAAGSALSDEEDFMPTSSDTPEKSCGQVDAPLRRVA